MTRLSAASAGRPGALFVSPEAPYPATGGGALRAASLAEYLGRRYPLDLIVFREPGAEDPSQSIPAGLVREVFVLPLPYHSRRFAARAARNLVRVLRARPPLNDRFGGFGAWIRSLLNGRRYEVAVLDHFWSAAYRDQAARCSGRVVLDLHNVESALLDSFATAARWPERLLLKRFQTACVAMERQWLPRFDLLLAASAEDAARLRRISPKSRIEVVPNTIPCVRQPDSPEEHAIVFSGNLDYLPNLEAVRFFRAQIWPRLRERWPGLAWRIVGKNPEAVRRHLAGDPCIDLLGPVADAVAALATAKVAVVPLHAGSGTRVKILEAWAAGTAVVSTTLGAEGLGAEPGKHLLIADGAERFAEAVSILLESESLRRSLTSAGRQLYETRFTWQAAWAKLEEIGI